MEHNHTDPLSLSLSISLSRLLLTLPFPSRFRVLIVPSLVSAAQDATRRSPICRTQPQNMEQVQILQLKQELAKAVTRNTELTKELQSVRGQLATEQSRCFKLEVTSLELERSLRIKEHLETSLMLKKLLLMLVLFGTSMVIADGVVTPAMSVMSTVNGLKVGIASVEKEKQRAENWCMVERTSITTWANFY